MAKLVSISSDDRALERTLARDENAAVQEVRECHASFSHCLASLAKAHPGTIAIGFFVAGRAFGPMVLAGSGVGDLCHETALNAMRALGRIVGRMSSELVAGFEIEFNLVREKDKLLAGAQQAEQAALAAADKEKRRG